MMCAAHKRKWGGGEETMPNKISSVLEKALLKMSFCNKMFD